MATIYQKINERGLQAVDEIKKQAKIDASNLEAEVINQAMKESSSMIEASQTKNNDIYKTKLTEIEQAAKQSSLKKKKQIISQAFDKAYDQLKKIDDKTLTNLVVNFIKRSNINGHEEIAVSKQDRSRYLSLFATTKNNDIVILDKLNALLGKEYHLTLSKIDALIDGGFIIKGEFFDIDNSFITILKNLSSTLESTVAAELFFESGK